MLCDNILKNKCCNIRILLISLLLVIDLHIKYDIPDYKKVLLKLLNEYNECSNDNYKLLIIKSLSVIIKDSINCILIENDIIMINDIDDKIFLHLVLFKDNITKDIYDQLLKLLNIDDVRCEKIFNEIKSVYYKKKHSVLLDYCIIHLV